MIWPIHRTLIIGAALFALHAQGAELSLRLSPDPAAPVVTQIVATEKVLMDAAPVENAPGWLTLELDLPIEGFVPTASLSKSMEIASGTALQMLPAANALPLTDIGVNDRYEIAEAEAEWTRVRLNKTLRTFFQMEPPRTPEAAAPSGLFQAPEPPTLELPIEPLVASPPNIQARPADASSPASFLSPEQLPPENVVWKSAPRNPAPVRQPQPQAFNPPPAMPALPGGIMVGPAETQAREDAPLEATADPTSRLLTGVLVREINESGPAYPLRLQSPEGRLIAYVDLSALFVPDLREFLNQRVNLRGPLQPLRSGERDLVIFAQEIRIAE